MSEQPRPVIVETYLEELAQLLRHLDPVEREEALVGVQAHIEETLAEGAGGPDDVRRVLTELGSPATVAESAYRESTVDTPPPPPATVVLLRPIRRWVPGLAALFLALAFVVGALAGGAAVGTSGAPCHLHR